MKPLHEVLLTKGGVLAAGVLSLRPAVRADLPFISWLWTDPETMAAVGGPLAVTAARMERWFSAMVDPGRPSDLYLLILAKDAQPIGEASLHRFDPVRGQEELNIKVAASSRGNGYGRSALLAMLRFFFDDAGGRLLLDDVAPGNHAGQALLASLGFHRDASAQGVRRFSLSAAQWRALPWDSP